MKIDLIVLKTTRPDELAKFYEQLGVKFEHHRHGTGPLHYAATVDKVIFEIYPLPKDKDRADDTLRLGFYVNDLDNVILKVRNLGTRIVKEPAMTEWGYTAIVEDLDGRKIELKALIV